MTAIYKRELRSYFSSMIAYIFIAFVLAFIGIFFMIYNLSSGYPRFSYSLSALMLIFVFAVPILTMKSMAEDRKNKTDQMLLTAPVTVTSIVLGKFLAMLTVFVIPLVISCLCPLIIATFGTAQIGSDYASIFSFICMGAMLVAIGMFVSSTTENQIISAVVTMAIMLVMYLWDSLVSLIPQTAMPSMIGMLVIVVLVALVIYSMSKNAMAAMIFAFVGMAGVLVLYFVNASAYIGLLPSILSAFSISHIVSNFTIYNVFDFGGLFFYLSVAVLFIFLTVQSVQKRRWS